MLGGALDANKNFKLGGAGIELGGRRSSTACPRSGE
jgi:hypothetical protein